MVAKIFFNVAKENFSIAFKFKKEKNICCLLRCVTCFYLEIRMYVATFVGSLVKISVMDYGKKRQRSLPRCLECGDSISYGRKDKKFCCEECKNKHHNKLAKMSKNTKRKVLAVLDKNYGILDLLLRNEVKALWLADAVAMGFSPGYTTSHRKAGKRELYYCFDISYVMTPNRLSSISKIQNLSLTLPPVHVDEQDEEDKLI